MNHMTTFSSTASAVVVAAALAIVTSTSALGACKATLRGELVLETFPGQDLSRKFLFFYLVEMTPDSPTGSEKQFQSFVVPNTKATPPIPFALDIDSPKDCPNKLELRVAIHNTDHPPAFSFGHNLSGSKTVRLDNFESIPVWGGSF